MSNKPAVVIKETSSGKRTATLAVDAGEAKSIYRDAYKNPKGDCVAVYLLEVIERRKIQAPPKPAATGKKVRVEVE